MKILFIGMFLFVNFAMSSNVNDPGVAEQWWLGSSNESGGANIVNSWEVANWNYDVKVVVIDYDFDLDHEDLKENIYVNENEIPDNGIDDDQNGYVNDYIGYSATHKKGLDVVRGELGLVAHGTHIMGITWSKTR